MFKILFAVAFLMTGISCNDFEVLKGKEPQFNDLSIDNLPKGWKASTTYTCQVTLVNGRLTENGSATELVNLNRDIVIKATNLGMIMRTDVTVSMDDLDIDSDNSYNLEVNLNNDLGLGIVDGYFKRDAYLVVERFEEKGVRRQFLWNGSLEVPCLEE